MFSFGFLRLGGNLTGNLFNNQASPPAGKTGELHNQLRLQLQGNLHFFYYKSAAIPAKSLHWALVGLWLCFLPDRNILHSTTSSLPQGYLFSYM